MKVITLDTLPTDSPIQKAIGEFLANFTSEHTRKSYHSDLKSFFQFMHDHFKDVEIPEKLERNHVVLYRNFLSETGGHHGRPSAPKTICRKIAALSSFFDYIVERGHMQFNVASSVKRPRHAVQSPTQAITSEEIRQLFNYIEDKKSASKFLHKALLATFFTTGLRKSEILELKFGDIIQVGDRPALQFRGKGGKIGQKLLHPFCHEAISQYVQWMKDQNRSHGSEDWLFQPTRNPSDPKNLNRPLNPKTVNQIFDHYAKKNGLKVKLVPHGARASFITELLADGVDIYKVANEVHHSSVKTTQEYDKRRKGLEDSPIDRLKF